MDVYNESEPAISFSDVDFGYQAQEQVLRTFSMSVPQGAIYGFLGANGAGKSTTIRLLLGLLTPGAGRIRLWAKQLEADRLGILQRVGAMIESPSIYLHLTALENLKIACRYRGVAFSKIDEVLSLVNLQHSKNKPCKAFSTGMKQRLGLARALISDPDLLILDEPTNGLDPEGIIEVRDLLLELKAQGKTIFLSSHLLSEIEKTATHIGVIREGRMAFQGTVEELARLRSNRISVRITTSDAKKAADVMGPRFEASILDAGRLVIIGITEADIPVILRDIVNRGLDIYEAKQTSSDLETDFLALMDEGMHA